MNKIIMIFILTLLVSPVNAITPLREINYYPRDYAWERLWQYWPQAQSQMDADLDRIKALGANTVRIFLHPFTLGYPQPEAEALAHFDAALELIAAHDLKAHVNLFDCWWSVDDLEGSQNWLAAIVQPHQHDPRIAVWELQNEVNLADENVRHWVQTLFPYLKQYAGDTPATVSVNRVEWLADLHELTATHPLELYSLHWYPAESWTYSLPTVLDTAHQLIGEHAELLLGEFGLDSYRFSEASQAQLYRDVLFSAHQQGITHLGVWTLDDFPEGTAQCAGQIPEQAAEWHFGLFRRDDSAKPALSWLQNAFKGQPPSSLSPITLVNASFEQINPNSGQMDNWAFWDQNWSGQPTFSPDPMAHSGQYSVKVAGSANVAVGLYQQPILRVEPGQHYALQGYIKTQNLQGWAKLVLSWYDSDLNWLSADLSTPEITEADLTQWTVVTLNDIVPPSQADYFRVFAQMYSETADAYVWFDDIDLSHSTRRSTASPNCFYDDFEFDNTQCWQRRDQDLNNPPFWNSWRADHIDFVSGIMQLRLDDQPCSTDTTACLDQPYASGEYRSLETYGYGRFETRMKAAFGSGVISSFFIYQDQPHDEIDIEILGLDPTQMQINYFTQDNGNHEQFIPLGFDASAAFHTYAIEWLPNVLRWYVDDQLVHTEIQGDFPTTPGKIMMNLWPVKPPQDPQAPWGGTFDYLSPHYAQYDWVKYTPTLGAMVIDAKGNPTTTQAEFIGGISVEGATEQHQVEQSLQQSVNIQGEISVDPAHIGQLADIIVYAETQLPQSDERFCFALTRDTAGNLSIPLCDQSDITGFPAYMPDVSLTKMFKVPLYQGTFYYPGTLKIFFGYRLKTPQILVQNRDSLDITIGLDALPAPTGVSTLLPQFAATQASVKHSEAAHVLAVASCQEAACERQNNPTLKLDYIMPANNWGIYEMPLAHFDAHEATYLTLWHKGAVGGERFEVVLWSDCTAGFPGRPQTALITTTSTWQQQHIMLADFQPYVDVSRLCGLSLGFNDALHRQGTIYIDQIAFTDAQGQWLATLGETALATYHSLLKMIEPTTNLPQDRFSALLFDIMPQFASVRSSPSTNQATKAHFESLCCREVNGRHRGQYGLELVYDMPTGTWGSYSIDAFNFDVSKARYLEFWTRGEHGGERFEVVLWSDCSADFPGRPDSALITATSTWSRQRIPLTDFQAFVDLNQLCRLSIAVNDAIHPAGHLYLDQIAFVDAQGQRLPIALDEETNVTNIGLYIASLIGALELGWYTYEDVLNPLTTTLTHIEALPKSHGFPHTHNHVVSLTPHVTYSAKERCRNPETTGDDLAEPNLFSTVDLANLAAGLILLRQRFPELASRTTALLEAMEWDWLYDPQVHLLYGCRAFDGSASEWWHYDWLAADSRLAYFIAIGSGDIPAASWSNLKRDRETGPCTQEHYFEPGQEGGGLFMALLPAIFINEQESELGISACHFVAEQICHAQAINAPAWGWSATLLPPQAHQEAYCPLFEPYCGYDCLPPETVVAPHASMLASECITPKQLQLNLLALQQLGAREWAHDGQQPFDLGFRASIDWQKAEMDDPDAVTTAYLFLDQAMAFLSLVNAFTDGRIRALFAHDHIVQTAYCAIEDYDAQCQHF